MSIPPNTALFSPPADPRDYVDWKISLANLLDAAESVESYQLVLGAESVAAGLVISNDGNRAPSIVDSGKSILMWLYVEDDMRLDPMFDGSGVTLPIELTVDTNSIPIRTYQRTVAVKVAQQ